MIIRQSLKARWLAAAAVLALSMLPVASSSQTAIGGSNPRPLSATVPNPPPARPTTPVQTQPLQPVSLPVPESVVQQAEAHANGNFGDLKRGVVGGQIQKVWDDAASDAGIFRTDICEGCTYKIRVRERMVTVIELPEGEVISTFDNGDPELFEVVQRGERRFAVKPRGFGVDTNLLIYGKSGNVYPIYVRAERFNSKNVPDLLVRLEGVIRDVRTASLPPDTSLVAGNAGLSAGAGQTANASANAPSLAAIAEASKAAGGSKDESPADFVKKAEFAPDKLRGWGQYKLSGSGNDMKPETVFRDDYFTYVRFGEKWKSLELPTGYVVVDGIDELVNTRVEGTTFIIESVQRKLVLKSGKSYLCIEYTGV